MTSMNPNNENIPNFLEVNLGKGVEPEAINLDMRGRFDGNYSGQYIWYMWERVCPPLS